jgi:hypothetical protein
LPSIHFTAQQLQKIINNNMGANKWTTLVKKFWPTGKSDADTTKLILNVDKVFLI